MQRFQSMNRANSVIILVTFILFVAALFFKGLTHDILLEAGVFLVSVKLIVTTYYIRMTSARIEEKLDELLKK
jgi:hypothetical protein